MNPTNGSWWKFQSQPTSGTNVSSRIPLTAVGGSLEFPLVPHRMSFILPTCTSHPSRSLAWAYQLHYYVCFRTYRRRPSFISRSALLKEVVKEICERHDYHLLECHADSDQLRSLISLRPSQAISKVMQTLKSNSSRECRKLFDIAKPVWARGYFARSVGRMCIGAVRNYLEEQGKHHGYDSRVLPPVYRYRTTEPVQLTAAHSSFELHHHVVLSTYRRKGIFNSHLGMALTNYWLKVASKRGFAIDQVSVVPDHVHLIVRIVPSMSIEECTLLLMNNGQHFVAKNYAGLLVQIGVKQLWEASAYAGTCGEVTTALLKAWLRRAEDD